MPFTVIQDNRGDFSPSQHVVSMADTICNYSPVAHWLLASQYNASARAPIAGPHRR